MTNTPAGPKGWNTYLVSCTSMAPLLLNPMTEETLDSLTYGAARRKAPDKNISIREMAEKKVPRGPNGEYGFRSNYLFAALVEAGRHVIFDKKAKISTMQSSHVPVFLSIQPELVCDDGEGFIPFLDQEAAKSWIADRRRGVMSSGTSKVAVAIIRPKFPSWDFKVSVDIDEDYLDISKVQELFTAAGRIAGIGDFRPSRRGPFGRFTVENFVQVEQQLAAAA